MKQLQQQVEDLETKLSFQELTIEQLNQEVVKLNDLLAQQQFQLELMVSKIKAMEPSNIASLADETPPPHY
ncbi:MAG: SlyX family protein [Parashewanella sp.]